MNERVTVGSAPPTPRNSTPGWQVPLLILALMLGLPGLLVLETGDQPQELALLSDAGSEVSLQPGEDIWAGVPAGERETVVLGDALWSAAAGVWRLTGNTWARIGSVPDEGMVLAPDGSMWVHTTAQVLSDQLAASGSSGQIRKVVIQDDGTVWACSEGVLLHFDRRAWTSIALPTDLGVIGCELAVTSDGYVWVGTFNAWAPWAGGLARFDGTGWEVVHPLGDGIQLPVVALLTGPDGVLWAVLVEFEEPRAPAADEARFAGWAMVSYEDDVWTTYPAPVGSLDRLPVSVVRVIDGAVWYSATPLPPGTKAAITFDGVTWVRYREGQPIRHPASDPGGTVWLAGPEAVRHP